MNLIFEQRKAETMAIEAVNGKTALTCDVDMHGIPIYCEFGFHHSFTKKHMEECGFDEQVLATFCGEMYEYLHPQFEYCWTGIFRIVIISNPKEAKFEIETHYKVTLFEGCSESQMEDLCTEVTSFLLELDALREFLLTLDFRIEKRAHT
jgi:hypothetical protein